MSLSSSYDSFRQRKSKCFLKKVIVKVIVPINAEGTRTQNKDLSMATQLDSGFQSLQARAYTQKNTDIKKKKKEHNQTTRTKKSQKILATTIPLSKFVREIFQADGRSAQTSFLGPIMQQVGLSKDALMSHNQHHLDFSVKYLHSFSKWHLKQFCLGFVNTVGLLPIEISDLTKNCGSILQP